jgi:hypothetical protein
LDNFLIELGPKILDDHTGIHLLILIVNHIAPGSPARTRALIDKLRQKKLTDHPGLNVTTFNVEVKRLLDELTGSVSDKHELPRDLANMVVELYMNTHITRFDNAVNKLFDDLEADTKAFTPDQVLSKLGQTYTTEFENNRWPHKSHVTQLAEAVGQINALQRKLADKEKGSGNNNGPPSQSQPANPPEGKPELYVPPKEGESEVKMIDGKEHKFCTRCKIPRWRADKYRHTTPEHKTRKEIQAERAAKEAQGGSTGTGGGTDGTPGSANVLTDGASSPAPAAAPTPAPSREPVTGGLRFMSGLHKFELVCEPCETPSHDDNGIDSDLLFTHKPRVFLDDDDDDDASVESLTLNF